MVGLGVAELLVVLVVLGLMLMFVAAVAIVLVLVLRKKPDQVEGTQAMPGPRQVQPWSDEPRDGR